MSHLAQFCVLLLVRCKERSFLGELVGYASSLFPGEPQFLETMQLKYNEAAEQKGVFVVGSCGFDSIPSDMGGIAVHRAMEGPVNKASLNLFF